MFENREEFDSAWGSTTHAENTVKNAQTLLVDWVTVSFKTAFNLQEIFQFIGIDNLEKMETIQGAKYQFAGYHVTYKLGMIELMYDENEQRYLLNMSGQGCREYELLSGHDFVHLFALLNHLFPTYTRLDIAIDIYDGVFNTNMFRQAVFNKQCVTRLREWGNNTRGLIESGNDFTTMDSFYLGGKSSRYFINVYDKKKERAAKDLHVDLESWTRLEVRFKSEYAVQMIENILRSSDDFGKEVFEFLNDKITFLKPSVAKKTDNKSRDAQDLNNHVRWWRSFLKTTKKLHLTVYKPDMPLKASKAWLLDKVSTTLALFNRYYSAEDYYKLLDELRLLGEEKMTKRHLKRLEHQVILDEVLASGEADLDWVRNEVVPIERKIVDLSTKKNREKHIENLKDVYWEQVREQQKKSNAFEDERF